MQDLNTFKDFQSLIKYLEEYSNTKEIHSNRDLIITELMKYKNDPDLNIRSKIISYLENFRYCKLAQDSMFYFISNDPDFTIVMKALYELEFVNDELIKNLIKIANDEKDGTRKKLHAICDTLENYPTNSDVFEFAIDKLYCGDEFTELSAINILSNVRTESSIDLLINKFNACNDDTIRASILDVLSNYKKDKYWSNKYEQHKQNIHVNAKIIKLCIENLNNDYDPIVANSIYTLESLINCNYSLDSIDDIGLDKFLIFTYEQFENLLIPIAYKTNSSMVKQSLIFSFVNVPENRKCNCMILPDFIFSWANDPDPFIRRYILEEAYDTRHINYDRFERILKNAIIDNESMVNKYALHMERVSKY